VGRAAVGTAGVPGRAVREQAQPVDWSTSHTHSLRGGALLGQGRHAEAEPLIVAGYGFNPRGIASSRRRRPAPLSKEAQVSHARIPGGGPSVGRFVGDLPSARGTAPRKTGAQDRWNPRTDEIGGVVFGASGQWGMAVRSIPVRWERSARLQPARSASPPRGSSSTHPTAIGARPPDPFAPPGSYNPDRLRRVQRSRRGGKCYLHRR
jgi:hypothetical protein